VLLHPASTTAHVVLEPPYRLLEGVVDGQVHVLVLGMLGGISRDHDLLARYRQADANVVKVPLAMAPVRRFDHDLAGLDLVEVLLELVSSILDGLGQRIGGLETSKGYLYWMFHDAPRKNGMVAGEAT